jgi:hypothetical protein
VNFNPSLLKTHKGLVLDKVKEDMSYSFDRNDVFIGNREQTNIFVAYTFFLKNIMNYYERKYKRIQDTISSIGGVYKFITIVAIYINSIYSNYIILSDTLLLLHSSILVHKNKIEIKKDNKKLYSYLGDKIKNIKNKERSEIKSSERTKLEKIDYTNIKNNTVINNNSKSNNNIIKENTQPNIDLNIKKDNLEKGDNHIERMDTKKMVEQKKNFCAFFINKITCGKTFNYYDVIRDFRLKIISEEHLIKNHLNIYNLLRVTKRKRSHKRNSYQLKDLVNLA